MSETAPLSHTIVASGREPSRQCQVWLSREPATDGEADGLELLSPE